MARAAHHRPDPWIAFLAGAVIALMAALVGMAWVGQETGVGLIRVAARIVGGAPELPRPRLPQAPHIPDAPTPVPK